MLSLPAFFARGALGAIPRGLLQSASPRDSLFEIVPPSASGLTWRHSNGRSPEYHLPETTGAGCAFLDYDNDGWMDIFLLSGTRLEGDPPGATNRLYKNNRDGTFTDVTEKSGLKAVGWASGGGAAEGRASMRDRAFTSTHSFGYTPTTQRWPVFDWSESQ